MQLSTAQRFKLHVRQPLLSALGIGGNVPVKLEETEDGVSVLVEGRRVHVPAALCWKYYRQGWEGRLARLEQEYGIGERFTLDEDSVVLDIGANTGEFAHVCARYGARVICFEPDPSVYKCLARNVAETPGVETHDLVVWKEDGEIAFGLAPERHDSSVFAHGAPRVMRRAQRLDSFAKARGIARVTLLKCDAEGAEPEVLEGAGAFLKQVAFVSIDTGAERMGARTNLECASLLEAAGFEVVEDRIGTRHMTYGVNRSFS
jgi:FkbM family methyltransferase